MRYNRQAWRDAHCPQLEDGSHILTATTFKLEIPAPTKLARQLKQVAAEQLGDRREVLDVALMVTYKTVVEAEGF